MRVEKETKRFSDSCGQKKVGGRKPSEGKRATNNKIGAKTRQRFKISKSAAARRSVLQRIRATAKRPWQTLVSLGTLSTTGKLEAQIQSRFFALTGSLDP